MRPVARVHVREGFDVERERTHAEESNPNRRNVYSRIGCEHRANAVDDEMHLIRARVVPQRHGWMEPELVAYRQGLEAHVRDLTVRDGDEAAIQRPDARGS